MQSLAAGGFLIFALGVAGGMGSGAAQQWIDFEDVIKKESDADILYEAGHSLIGTAVYANYCCSQ